MISPRLGCCVFRRLAFARISIIVIEPMSST